MQNKTNIAKNASFLTVALIAQRAITFFYFIFLARFLGPEDLGKYYFALSFAFVFSIFIDVGLANITTREVARLGARDHSEETESKRNAFLGNILGLKFILAFVCFIAGALFINLIGDYPLLTRQLVYIALLVVILDSFSNTLWAVLRGFHNIFYESIGGVISVSIYAGLGVMVLRSGLGLRSLMAGMMLSYLFVLIYPSLVLIKKFKLSLKPIFSLNSFKKILILAAPFALFVIFQRGITYFDSVLLSYFSGDRAVGIYQVPFKIINALQFLPMALSASLYPALCLYWLKDKDLFSKTFTRALNYLAIISMPMAAGAFVLADKIVLIFSDKYLEAVLPMRLVIASLPFIFLTYAMGAVLNATERQKTNTAIAGATLLVSVSLNLVLIPIFGVVGAATTLLVVNIFNFCCYVFYPLIFANFFNKKLIFTLLKIIFSALIMGYLVMIFEQKIGLVPVIIFGGFIYSFLILILGVIKIGVVMGYIKKVIKKPA